MTSKRELRRRCFAAVKAMSPEEKAAASGRICEKLQEDTDYQKAGCVFSYLALPSEPDLISLFSSEKKWAFSRVRDDGESMDFHEMKDPDEAIIGEFKFREPNPEKCPVVSPDEADVILIPGVGFDPQTCDRLGRGKGHYDRYLSQVDRQSVTLIGICFSGQIVKLNPEPHDIPMDRVVTD